MAKINVLEPSVFNQISAGEVVERPSSIIKELLENSIDAGATKIEVNIFDGGISKIIITDNGCGIAPDDLELAFLPHATSKIKDINDLYNLSTLGFRGEALASIASVTEVEVTSKTNDGNGCSIKLSGGTVIAKGEKGSPVGTQFCVENLFFNTPARKKFLKLPKKEETEVTNLMTRLILANPFVAIKYTADGKTIFSSTGKGIEDAIFAIYGADTLKNIVPVLYESEGYSIRGFVGKTTFFKPNRTYQTIMINGRWVAESTISMAVSQCYESYMMKHCFPFCVLYVDMPISEVDVNVHPNKLEVRFQNNKKIFDFVYRAISNSLFDDITKKTSEEVDLQEQAQQEYIADIFKPIEAKQEESKKSNEASLDLFFNENEEVPEFLEVRSAGDSILGEIILDKLVAEADASLYNFDTTKEENYQKVTPKPVQTQLVADEIEDKNKYLATKIIGKLFNTFIIAEFNDEVYFIDQHAAHERLLFDKYVKNVKNQDMCCQPLLLPYNIKVNHAEEEFLLEHLELLKQLGFDIELFGSLNFKISAIPSLLPDLNVEAFFHNFLSNINTIVQMKSIDLVIDNLAETACKHAVKGGDDLKQEEIVNLVAGFCDGSVTLQCPHGRPFVVKFTRKELDKWFKRVV